MDGHKRTPFLVVLQQCPFDVIASMMLVWILYLIIWKKTLKLAKKTMMSSRENNVNEKWASFHLGQRLVPKNVFRQVFAEGPATQYEIVTTSRLILILKGEMDYTIEGETVRMGPGSQFLVPAWVRRVWSVTRKGKCEVTWFEFDDGEHFGESVWFHRRLEGAALEMEKRSFKEMCRLWREEPPPWRELKVEGELKSVLSRFWQTADPLKADGKDARKQAAEVRHPRIKAMLRWMEKHYASRDVLKELYRQAGMNRNYFRILFVREVGCAPHVHIESLRLRHARYLLHSTEWQLKRIATEVGYDDPLYFSKRYRRYWQCSPSQER